MEFPYSATGSGVTPNHASSVIQIPSSYREKMLYRWEKYLNINQIQYIFVIFFSSTLLNVPRYFAYLFVMVTPKRHSVDNWGLSASFLPHDKKFGDFFEFAIVYILDEDSVGLRSIVVKCCR